jgi:O-methyltransferase domain
MSEEPNATPWPTLTPPLQLYMLGEGAVIATALSLVAELGIADLLKDGPRSSEELAQATFTHQRALYRVLRVLSMVGVFTEVQPDHFDLTPMGQLLRSDIPDSMRSWIRMINRKIWFHTYAEASYSLRTGHPAFERVVGAEVFEYLDAHPDEGTIFNEAMNDMTRGVATAIVQEYDFSGINKIVDLGGGHGILITTILQAYPKMKGLLFDMPQVADGARPMIAAAGLAQRCEIVAGDFFSSVPAKGDAYLLKWIIHDWPYDQALTILQNCRNVMKKTSRLLLIETVILEGDAFDPGKTGDFVMLTALGGQERTETEYALLLDEAGFHLSRVVPTTSSMSIIEGSPK